MPSVTFSLWFSSNERSKEYKYNISINVLWIYIYRGTMNYRFVFSASLLRAISS
jgi:hypothetical protein